ncbi:MAG: hypothetical protein EXR74_03425 [Bdellovibrionales bacterium]|nr:hypothetical protein [Bdellovibrionales bacterium]
MSVGLTLVGSILATVGFFSTVYGVVILLTEGRRVKAKPRLGLASGVGAGSLSVWVNWDPSLFAMQIYRLRISHVSPERKSKEGTFTVTFDSPQTQPFIQPIEMPDSFRAMLDGNTNDRSLFTFEFRTVDEMSLFLNYNLRKVKKFYKGIKRTNLNITHVLPLSKQDPATIFSLDFEELQARKNRMKGLEVAAKAKAAKAALAKPVVAPAPPPTIVAKVVEAVAAPEKVQAKAPLAKPIPPVEKNELKEMAKPVPVVTTPKIEAGTQDKAPALVGSSKVEAMPEDKIPPIKSEAATPAKSVRDLVSASNKNQPE